jgi:hypothetical protein
MRTKSSRSHLIHTLVLLNRQGSPRKRKGPVPGTKGKDRFRSEEAFYENPLPDCLCQQGSPASDDSLVSI